MTQDPEERRVELAHAYPDWHIWHSHDADGHEHRWHGRRFDAMPDRWRTEWALCQEVTGATAEELTEQLRAQQRQEHRMREATREERPLPGGWRM